MATDYGELPLDPHRFRPDFPILNQTIYDGRPLIYFDNAATTQHPLAVIDCISEFYRRYYANVHRGIHCLSEKSSEMYERARRKVQSFLGAEHFEEIVFTAGTTMSINLVARTWGDANLRAGDEILLTMMEHHSNTVPWQQLAVRTGCTLRYLPLTDDGRLDLDQLDNYLTENTKLLSVCGTSNVLGTINPVEQIIQRAHQNGTLVLVDGAQSVPHAITDVRKMDADFLAFSGHKMLGPSGIGVLYAKRDILDAMPPFLGGGSMIGSVRLEGFTPGMLPARFEAGTPPIVEAVGLGTAIDYLSVVGLENIHRYEEVLVRRAYELMGDIPGMRLLGPAPEHKAGIVAFAVEGVHANDLAEFLDRRGIAVRAGHHCTMPLHHHLGIAASARASFYFYNTLEEVDLFGEALARTIKLLRRR